MNQKKLVIIALGLLTIYGSFSNAKCDRPTAYKSSHYYTVYLTKPETTPDNFYLVLIGNNHSLYGGQAHTRINNEPIIEFKHYRSKNFLNPKLAFVHYRDFMDAINSDQPAHNVRVRS